MTTTHQDGWIITRYTDRLVVQGPEPDQGADERIEVYTQDDCGQWHRTYVEVGEDGPIVVTERVSGPPVSEG